MYRSLFHENYSSLRSLSSSPIVKHSNLASSPAIMTTIGATVSTLASPVKYPALSRFSSLISFNQSISQPKFNTESNSSAIISSLSPPEKSPAISSNQSINLSTEVQHNVELSGDHQLTLLSDDHHLTFFSGDDQFRKFNLSL
ncbi:hypothetical protein POM88_048792 [Heracleum sosnowskyi]|uniref:Uncharacterized protein n=1 Tax=Heracleum sosnowskyi TaxID=360622 RepID=A0AAD8GVV1_9APIA|nr:hypothetical protein POM88_048792 [Heracleum sosnowskyi]